MPKYLALATSTSRLTQASIIQAHFRGSDQIGAMFSQTWEAVYLQDVEAVIVIKAHVHTSAIVAAKSGESLDCQLLGSFQHFLTDIGGAGMVDCASTLPRFVFIGVDGRSVAAEEEFYRWKSFGRRIAKKSNVDFSSRDVLLYKYGLPEFLEDDFSGFAQLVGVVDHTETK